MLIEVLKSKLHRVTVTEANLDYVGNITIDEILMEAANFVEGEKVRVVNINNGERLETYVIRGKRESGDICINGAAARKVAGRGHYYCNQLRSNESGGCQNIQAGNCISGDVNQ